MTDFAVGLITPCFIYKFLTTVHSGETAYVYVPLAGCFLNPFETGAGRLESLKNWFAALFSCHIWICSS